MHFEGNRAFSLTNSDFDSFLSDTDICLFDVL